MRVLRHSSIVFLLASFAIGCSSTKPQVDREEPKRVLGRESDVRLDAQVFSDKLMPNSAVEVRYEIENLRSAPIAIADLLPETAFDAESRTITIKLGSEVPGNELLPRLLQINSGEKKAFSAGARLNIRLPAGPFVPYPRFLRVQLHFLGDVKPFETLIDIPERAVRNPQMADAIFPTWIENIESVTTNAIPIQWNVAGSETEVDPSSRLPARRRRPRGVP